MPSLRGSLRLAGRVAALAAAVLTTAAAAADDGVSFGAKTLRVATFNASLSPFGQGGLEAQLADPADPQARAIAEIIQRVDPDVLLINEFNFDENEGGESRALALFMENFLEVPQNGAAPVRFDHVFLAPSNTGVPSGFDLDNDGSVGGGNDAFGFGVFPGHFGMVLLSKHPILEDRVRTFRKFLWKDMPGALLPDDPATPAPKDWYAAEELEVFRLSSKSHWDVPVKVAGRAVHMLASHPTPPVFDGPEDRNGTRNHDEIRFWSDYVLPFRGRYIYDDEGRRGGLRFGRSFVVLGDLNADPSDRPPAGAGQRRRRRCGGPAGRRERSAPGRPGFRHRRFRRSRAQPRQPEGRLRAALAVSADQARRRLLADPGRSAGGPGRRLGPPAGLRRREAAAALRLRPSRCHGRVNHGIGFGSGRPQAGPPPRTVGLPPATARRGVRRR